MHSTIMIPLWLRRKKLISSDYTCTWWWYSGSMLLYSEEPNSIAEDCVHRAYNCHQKHVWPAAYCKSQASINFPLPDCLASGLHAMVWAVPLFVNWHNLEHIKGLKVPVVRWEVGNPQWIDIISSGKSWRVLKPAWQWLVSDNVVVTNPTTGEN